MLQSRLVTFERSHVTMTPQDVVVDERLGCAYVAAESPGSFGQVSVLDAASGRLLQSTDVGLDLAAVAADARSGRAFVATAGDDTVSVLDARSGAFLGTSRVGATPDALAVDGRDGRVLVANRGSRSVTLLDARSGAVLRTLTVGAVPCTVAVDEHMGRAFVANAGDGTVSLLDLRRDTLLRTVPVGGLATNVAVDESDGRAVVAGIAGACGQVGSAAGHVSVLDARSGALIRAVDRGAGPLAVDTRSGHVVVTVPAATDRAGTPTGSGHVDVLNARTGDVVRTFSIGVAPVAVAVDTRTGRTIVVNAGGAVRVYVLWARLGDLWQGAPPPLRRWLPWLPHRALITIPGSVSVLDSAG